MIGAAQTNNSTSSVLLPVVARQYPQLRSTAFAVPFYSENGATSPASINESLEPK